MLKVKQIWTHYIAQLGHLLVIVETFLLKDKIIENDSFILVRFSMDLKIKQ